MEIRSIYQAISRKKNTLKISSILAIAVSIITVAFLVGSVYRSGQKIGKEKEQERITQEKVQEEFELNTMTQVKKMQDSISIESWKDYQTKWYGFKVKYPEDWKKPAPKVADRDSKAEYKYEFRAPDSNDGLYAGFDVKVYNISKTKELSNTDEFPKLKNPDTIDPQCEIIKGRLLETGDYASEEIYVPAADMCYSTALFFSVTSGDYIYNMVPVIRDGVIMSGDPMKEVSDNMPEFFSVISTFENIEISRVVITPKPKITAPIPAWYKRDEFGRLVCAKKNDKPRKSKTKKKKHLDMECCLDPDEYPNPHCYYDPVKYGKYLK
ncbi:hypothetical protein ACFL3M_01525 [Patescibacteria group bacterium]